MNIGERIKTARKNADLTQKELGTKLGVSAAMIAQYESGKRNPKLETLDKIADALGLDVWALYEDYTLPENDIEFEHAWENLLIMNGIRFMSYTKHTGEHGLLFAIEDGKFRYFLSSEQCEKLPDISIAQIKTLIRTMADKPFTSEENGITATEIQDNSEE